MLGNSHYVGGDGGRLLAGSNISGFPRCKRGRLGEPVLDYRSSYSTVGFV